MREELRAEEAHSLLVRACAIASTRIPEFRDVQVRPIQGQRLRLPMMRFSSPVLSRPPHLAGTPQITETVVEALKKDVDFVGGEDLGAADSALADTLVMVLGDLPRDKRTVIVIGRRMEVTHHALTQSVLHVAIGAGTLPITDEQYKAIGADGEGLYQASQVEEE